MTPPISSESSVVYIINDPIEKVCRPAEPEELVCREGVDSYSLELNTAPKLDVTGRFHAARQRALALAKRSQLSLSAFGEGGALPSAVPSGNPLKNSLAGGLAALFPAACSNGEEPIEGDPNVDGAPPTENPDPNPTNQDGIGSVDENFANSDCQNPVDMDLSAIDSNMIMTCGDDQALNFTLGAAKLEIINPATGEKSQISLPLNIDGDTNRPILLSSTQVGSGSSLYTGFAASGTSAQFEADSTRFGNSGIFEVNQETGDVSATHSFEKVDFFINLEMANPDGAVDQDGNVPTLGSLRPNTPVSMVRVGDALYVLNANRVLNYAAAYENQSLPAEEKLSTLSYGPTSIHVYDIGADGTLTPRQVTAQETNIDGTPLAANEDGVSSNGYYMIGRFNPTAIADLGDGRIAVVTRGVGEGNDSEINVYNAEDFSSGLVPSSGQGNDSSTIVINDGSAFNFGVNNSSQLAIVQLGGVPHAVLGSADGSGRVALVNLDPDAGEQRVKYIGVFNEASLATATDEGGNEFPDVATIIPDGDRAYVISAQGHIRTLFLAEDTAAGIHANDVGPIHTLATVEAGTRIEAALRANNLVAAYPGGYSHASIE